MYNIHYIVAEIHVGNIAALLEYFGSLSIFYTGACRFEENTKYKFQTFLSAFSLQNILSFFIISLTNILFILEIQKILLPLDEAKM
jgi:hypothetical protein